MIIHKKIFLIASTLSLTLGAGCTQTQQPVATNVNSNTNTNVVSTTNENVNVGNVNVENTNVSAVDTTDWKTYTNEEYGFSFRYPKDLRLDVRHEDDYFRVYVLNADIQFDYDFMAFSFSQLSGLTLEQWFKKNVDINDVLNYQLSETKEGYQSLSPEGASSLDDLNGYAQIVSFIEDSVNDRAVAVFGGQDFSVLESLGHNNSDVILQIIYSLQFKK